MRAASPPEARNASRFLASALVLRALRLAGLQAVSCRGPTVLALRTDDVANARLYRDAARELLGKFGSTPVDAALCPPTTPQGLNRHVLDAEVAGWSEAMLDRTRFCYIVTEPHVPEPLATVVDGLAEIGLPDVALIRAAVLRSLGRLPSQAEVTFLLDLPIDKLGAVLDPAHSLARTAAFQRRVDAAQALVDKPDATSEAADRTANETHRARTSRKDYVGPFTGEGPRLEELSGLGEAGEWGALLARDLADYRAGRIPWSDVDRGVLVSGPPGSGKTTFAVALARSCAVPIFVHSLARWQAGGNLDAVLRLMRAAFQEAKEHAPAILFVDEADAFGDRIRQSDHNVQYTRQVIDGFLECLDGADGREGVVVVGATNFPDLLDPAIRRSGRLDRLVAIPLPDRDARLGILRHHLRDALIDAELSDVVDETDGFTGADLERLVRDGRRRARLERRELRVDHLAASLPPAAELSDAAFRRACVHEAGHFVIGAELAKLSGQIPVEATVRRRERGGFGSATTLRPVAGFDETRASRLALVTVLLAGLAAEEIIIGDRGPGSGGSETSDLVRATALVADMELHRGLGERLRTYWEGQDERGRPMQAVSDRAGEARIEAVLQDCLKEAMHMTTRLNVEIRAVADHLFSNGRIVVAVAPPNDDAPV